MPENLSLPSWIVTHSVRAGVTVVAVIALASALFWASGSESHPSGIPQRTTKSACTANNLEIVLANVTGAMGTGFYSFTATNVGSTTCNLDGFFGIAIVGLHRKLLTRSDSQLLTTLNGQRVVERSLALRPSGEATTTVALGENPVNGATTCPLITGFYLTPPHSTRPVRVVLDRKIHGWFCQPIGSKVMVYATRNGPPSIR